MRKIKQKKNEKNKKNKNKESNYISRYTFLPVSAPKNWLYSKFTCRNEFAKVSSSKCLMMGDASDVGEYVDVGSGEASNKRIEISHG